MKRSVFLVCLMLVYVPIYAQTQTAVSATITDPNGIPYANGTYSIQLIPTGNNPSVGGAAIQGAFNGSLSATGSFSASLWPNASITPASTQWSFTICSNSGGIQPPLGTGTQCTPPTAITISGTAQVLTTTLSNVAPKLTNFSGGVNSFPAESANTVFAGPSSGAAANPAFRALTQADLLPPSTPGIPQYCGSNCFYAANYGVKANAIRYYDCSFVNNSKTVNCGITAAESDVPFTSAMLTTGPGGGGWLVFGTNGSPTAGAQPNSRVIVPVGTITAVNSPTQIVVSLAATNGCTSTVGADQCQLVIAPNDDTSSLNEAYQSATSSSLGPSCGTLVLPQGNMWITARIWNPSSSACDGGQQANGAAAGFTVLGYGYNQSVIIPAPSSDWVNVVGNTAAFFFNLNFRGTGAHYRNFSIDGAGQQANVGASGAALLLGQDSSMTDVGIFQWGTAYAVQASGADAAEAVIDHCNFAAAGTTYIVNENFDVKMTNTALAWGVGTAMLNVQSIQNTSIADTFDNPGGSTIMVTVGAAGVFWSTADYFETPEGSAAISLPASGGVLHLAHADFRNPHGSTSVGISSVAGTSVYMQDSIMSMNANSGKGLNIAGAFYDLGGNNIQTATANTISGNVFGSASITGTAASAGNWVFSAGWGSTAAATSVSGNTQRTRYTVTASGTGQAANPTITHTFATAFLAPPVCTIKQDDGTQTAVANPFTVGTPATTSVVYTYTGTPGAGNTLVLEEDCSNP